MFVPDPGHMSEMPDVIDDHRPAGASDRPTHRSPRRLGHRPALDGLRGAAFVMVFVDHTRLVADLQFGEVAMYVFLALSGFLVTVPLLGEAGLERMIRVRRFFARRARRLLPALGTLLVVWLAVVALFPHAGWTATTPGGGATGPTDFGVAIRGSIGALGYLTNWLDILGLYGGRFPLGHLWFVAAQEQLYLLWVPVMALLACRLRRLMVPVALVLAAASTAWALLLMHQGANWMRIYAGTDTRAASILLGSALAMGWTTGRFHGLTGGGWATAVRAACLGVLGWALFTFSTRHASVDDGLAWVACTVAGGFLVLAVTVAEQGWVHRLLSHRALGYLGSRSYALYLWHYVWLTWLAGFGLVGIAGAVLASLLCAEVSWQLVERRFGPRRRPDPSGPGPDARAAGVRPGARRCANGLGDGRAGPHHGGMSRPSTARAHFNHAGSSIPPASVVDRVVSHLRLEAEIGGYEAAELVADELISDRVAIGAAIGVPGDDVVVVESATQAWTTIVWAMALSGGWGPHDRVVVDQFAYVSSLAVLMQLRAVSGVQIVVAPAGPDGVVEPNRLAEVIDSATRLVLVTHVPTHVGTVTPLDDVAAAMAGLDTDAVLALDISQSLGQLPVDVVRLGASVAFAPGRKFLRAPRGTGVLYVAPGLAGSVVPLALDLTATASITTTGVEPAPGARRFDLFEHSVALRLGLGQAARHLSSIGIEEVARGVAQRTQAVVEVVSAVPSLTLVAPAPLHGIVSFTHARLDPAQVRAELAGAGVNVWTNVANGSPIDGERRALGPSVRVSPHAVTTDDELDRLHRALRRLA